MSKPSSNAATSTATPAPASSTQNAVPASVTPITVKKEKVKREKAAKTPFDRANKIYRQRAALKARLAKLEEGITPEVKALLDAADAAAATVS